MSFLETSPVSVSVGGKAFDLAFTLRAWRDVNLKLGSFGDAFVQVNKGNGVSIASVISIGSGAKYDDVEALVAENGLDGLLDPLKEYLDRLANGGKKSTPTDNAKDAPKGEG